MAHQDYSLPLNIALERLMVITDYDFGDNQPGEAVHALRDGGVLIGAYWDYDEVKATLSKYGAYEAGPEAADMGHGIVTVDDYGSVFFETQPM